MPDLLVTVQQCNEVQSSGETSVVCVYEVTGHDVLSITVSHSLILRTTLAESAGRHQSSLELLPK